MKDQLIARVSREKRSKEFDEYVKGLRSKASINVNDAELEKVVVAAAPGVDAARAMQAAQAAPGAAPAPVPQAK